MAQPGTSLTAAVQDFWRARRRANLHEALSFLRREPTELLSYEEVRHRLRGVESTNRRLEEVPLDRIVGSVGRYNDFTRGFLPRQNSDKDRWAGVLRAMTGMEGVPPIEVYRVGDVYFVKDGNHRVSVARQLGARYLQAYVTPVHTRVPLGPDDDAQDLIIKAEYADFLLDTGIDELRPGADLTLTEPGQYEKLKEHISVHRYFMGIDLGREVTYREAVTHWYDTVYLPVVESIRRNGLLRGFPGRTETDLYLWLAEHRATIEQQTGFSLTPQSVVEGVAVEVAGPGRTFGPERRERVLRSIRGAGAVEERVCEDILVALHDSSHVRIATVQAIEIARREGARLYGLFVAADNTDMESEVDSVREEFQRLCSEAQIPAQFAVTSGRVSDSLLERSRWSDLLVVPLPQDERGQPLLNNAFRSFLRHCPRPILTVRNSPSELSKLLVAFDGGNRAEAALFIAAYAAAKWRVELTVLTVVDALQPDTEPLEQARRYLEEFGIVAEYLEGRGKVPETIVSVARDRGCDAILMGSYRYNRFLESVLGGVLEETLRSFPGPVLVA